LGQWSGNDFSPFSADDIVNLPSLAGKLKQPADAVSLYLKNQLSAATLEILTSYQGTNSSPIRCKQHSWRTLTESFEAT